ncbi:flagellar basal body rod protein FlgC [Clostridium formicaceticum]|uniref:Flagellar basal-body rod protein FlgC n=1 Tax=Clostridium formicaceticum TaxID=1497 RepID=A0AAC9WGF2_9CLOT|nr:flagellar basal body rod protein FlgC [Clostridium formicaceticum]AOY77324.1 flagellar basal body rod protein FlgC [Clostridium formicaceticum]ARE87868.1 Flagellar basal-body rod protein FlgC [Clostridium formicaceticum]
MSIFNAINASASGLTAERLRMDVISKNIANATTTRTVNGGPYRRQVVVFKEKDSGSFSQIFNQAIGKRNSNGQGVEVVGIRNDQTPFKKIHDPGHPDADEQGYVLMPNVEIVTEMANMISASRAYEANITALNATKNMALKALELGR